MTVLLIVVLSAAVLLLVGRFYSRFLARQFGESDARPTPAATRGDGRDYVATPTPVVFAHHFASIAGAGPIIGPVLAVCYGWGPALFWVLLGGLFIGGVHDYLAAYMSTRENGRSIATVARRLLGRGPFVALVLFLVLMLGLVCAAFLNLSATALTSMLPLATVQLPDDQTLFRVVGEGLDRQVVVGGIASTSVIIVTALAPLLGWMYLKKRVAVWKCSLLAILICGLSITIGLFFPVALRESVTILGVTIEGTSLWKLILAAYCLLAAGVPVWLFLQSRDFINVHILYVGMAVLMLALVVGSLRTPAQGDVGIPMFDMATGKDALGFFWPALFITIACGAVSGFHSLCAGGTTCKQLKSESAARYAGYWAMLLETFLAICVIAVLLLGVTKADYLGQVYPHLVDASGRSNPVLGFALGVGAVCRHAFGVSLSIGVLAGMILLEGFLVTTLDTAVRLMRYLLEEVWREVFGRYDVFAAQLAAPVVEAPAGSSGIPSAVAMDGATAVREPVPTTGAFNALLRFLRLYWVNSGIAVAVTLFFAFSGGILSLWPLFATSNQLLAALVLGLGAIWLLRRGRKAWYVVAPAAFMLATTGASLLTLIVKYTPHQEAGKDVGNTTLFVADGLLIVLTAYLLIAGISEAVSLLRHPSTPAAR